MGKSPGRWMKTLLFGKKSSRSKVPKAKDELRKGGDDKGVLVAFDPDGSTDLSLNIIQKNEGNIEENLESLNLQHEERTRVPHKQEVSIAVATESGKGNDSDRIGEEQAATKMQSALRGYLARRAFRTLKGITRLQALVRGHLVRRQAISTLYCLFRIVKLQALSRGRKIRHSDIGVEVQKRCSRVNHLPVGVNLSTQLTKLATRGFAQKVIASSMIAMPLHFQYDPQEANSVLSWLERWSTSQFWQPLPKHKKGSSSRSFKPTIRKSSVTSVENVSSEFDKPRRILRKVSRNQTANSVEEDPQQVLEKVKRSLRRVHNPVSESIVQIETETEKKKTNDDNEMKTAALSETESAPKPVIDNEVETRTITENEKEDETLPVRHEGSCDDGSISKEKKKSRRRVSLPAKQEFMENNEPPQMKRLVPSYMAATESAKAKLRGQDGPEKSNLTRRYSLPSSKNGKTSSVSPRVQRPTQTNGITGIKNDRSLQLSRDGNVKLNHAEWRR